MSTTERLEMTGLVCGGCQHLNQSLAKFCVACGHTLYELCAGCGQSVPLTAKFCNACGCDLKAALDTRLDNNDEKLQRAVGLAKQFRFHEAINLLKLVASEKDYRFRDQAQTANNASSKIEALLKHSQQQLASAKDAAKQAAEAGDHSQVVRELEALAPELLDADAQSLLKYAKSRLSESSQAKAELKAALVAKDWALAARSLERLLTFFPAHTTYLQLSKEVTERLLNEVEQDFAQHDYLIAHCKLEATLSHARDDRYDKLKQLIDDAEWLVSQFEDEPFATPTLGRLAMRLAKHATDNPLGRELVSRLSAKLKETPGYKQAVFPAWTGSQSSVIGGELRQLAWPRCVGENLPDAIKKQPFRFGVAIGLALQGIGEVRFDDQLIERKGILSNILSKSSPMAWGIDIGTSSLRAVCLSKDKAGSVQIVEAYYDEYSPTNQVATANESQLRAREAVVKMVEQLKLDSVKVWVNFPGRETLPRFLLLPPVDDKKAKAMLNAEVSSQFPVDVDQLALMKFVAESASDREGRPASLVSARKLAVSQRIDLLSSAGLKIAGMQCEPVALANYVYRELSDCIGVVAEDKTMNSIAVVDSGASATTLLIVHRDGFWFRTIDSGGAEATSSLARAAKILGSEAEIAKRDPSKLVLLAEQYVEIEKRQHSLVERLRQLLPIAQKAFPALRIDQTWLTGGNTLSHGWARRLSANRAKALVTD